jgi:DNA-binding transcriptional LysR family regulator
MAGTFRQLEVFVAACHCGSFAAAAEELGISQAAVSRHIAALEQVCGLPLYRRVAGAPGIITNYGARLLSEGEDMVKSSRALGYGSRHVSTRSIRVRVGADSIILNHIFRMHEVVLDLDGRQIAIEFERIEAGGDPAPLVGPGRLDLVYFTVPVEQQTSGAAELVSSYQGGLFGSPALESRRHEEPNEPIPIILPLLGTPLEQMMRRTLSLAGITNFRVAAHVGPEHAIELAHTGAGAFLSRHRRAKPSVEAGLLTEFEECSRPHLVGRYVLRGMRSSAGVAKVQSALSALIENSAI